MKNFKKLMVVLVAIFGLGLLSGCYADAKPKVLREDKEYLMYISHEDCSACQSIADQVNQYRVKAEADPSLIKFYKIDLKYASYTDAQADFGISATPTLLYIREGKVIKKAEGTTKVINLLEEKYGKL